MKKAGEVFEDVCDYDSKIIRVVPHYEEIHQVIIESLPFNREESFKVLELGTGTGNLAEKLLENFFNLKYYGIDYSEKMLEIAETKLRRYKRFTSVRAINLIDIGNDDQFDCIVSCLVIHHLTDKEKRCVFKKIFSLLHKPGFFINADPVRSDMEHLNKRNNNYWFDWMRAHGLSESEMMVRYTCREEVDKNSSLEEQIHWLKSSGFKSVETIWKRLDKVIFCASKE